MGSNPPTLQRKVRYFGDVSSRLTSTVFMIMIEGTACRAEAEMERCTETCICDKPTTSRHTHSQFVALYYCNYCISPSRCTHSPA